MPFKLYPVTSSDGLSSPCCFLTYLTFMLSQSSHIHPTIFTYKAQLSTSKKLFEFYLLCARLDGLIAKLGTFFSLTVCPVLHDIEQFMSFSPSCEYPENRACIFLTSVI